MKTLIWEMPSFFRGLSAQAALCDGAAVSIFPHPKDRGTYEILIAMNRVVGGISLSDARLSAIDLMRELRDALSEAIDGSEGRCEDPGQIVAWEMLMSWMFYTSPKSHLRYSWRREFMRQRVISMMTEESLSENVRDICSDNCKEKNR